VTISDEIVPAPTLPFLTIEFLTVALLEAFVISAPFKFQKMQLITVGLEVSQLYIPEPYRALFPEKGAVSRGWTRKIIVHSAAIINIAVSTECAVGHDWVGMTIGHPSPTK